MLSGTDVIRWQRSSIRPRGVNPQTTQESLPLRSRIFGLYGLFAISGFCGLIYESVWAQYLKLFLGHAAYAQTLVLVVFIGGMALGAAMCGRWAHRIARPLIAYAVVELIIGLAGVAFHSVYVTTTGWAYTSLLPIACS